MKTEKRAAVVILGMALCLHTAAEGQVLGTFEPAQASTVAGINWTTLDQRLLEALRAPDEARRRDALVNAQASLETGEVNSGLAASVGAVTDNAEWLMQTESQVVLFEDRVRKELRESLMHKLWESPYGAIPADGFDAFEIISDALRLVHEIQRMEAGGSTALAELRATYWEWLMAHREAAGLDLSAPGEAGDAPVFDQRILQDKDGKVRLYQLVGTEKGTIHWVQVPEQALPSGLLSSEGLAIDMSRENARWLLVLDGEHLGRLLEVNRLWLEAIGQEVRLVLIERAAYSGLLRDLPSEWFEPGRRMPYALPGSRGGVPGRIYLVQVADQRVLGSWPLKNLDESDGRTLKDLINRVLATTGLHD